MSRSEQSPSMKVYIVLHFHSLRYIYGGWLLTTLTPHRPERHHWGSDCSWGLHFPCFWIVTHLRSVSTIPTNGKKTEAPLSPNPKLGCHGWSYRWSCSTKRPARRIWRTKIILTRSVRATQKTSGCSLLDLGPELLKPIAVRYCSSEFPISTEENSKLEWIINFHFQY